MSRIESNNNQSTVTQLVAGSENASNSVATLERTEAKRLTDKHYQECVSKRGLNSEWVVANCRSMEIKDATARLGYTSKSAGIWLEGTNGFGQFRPNKPWKNEGDKKAPKYRTASGEEYDAMLPHHPHNPQYATDLETLKALCYRIDDHPCLILTEGLFKAIAGCSNGFPTIAIAGVEMGLTPSKNDVQGKRFLVETLEKLARAGFGFIIAFDADAATNEFVAQAQKKLGVALLKFKVPVYTVTGLWVEEQGKGMDDYIQGNGADSFRDEVLNKAVDFAAWEQQFYKDDNELSELTPKDAAQQLAERYRVQWKHDLAQQTWRRYNGSIWEQTPDKVFDKSVYHDLEAMPSVVYDNYAYVENVVKFLELELQERNWTSFPRAEWIAFNDCILEVATGKRHEHSPGFMFTSCLDHNCPNLKFNEGGDLLELTRLHAPTFYSWAMYAQGGDSVKVLKLLAILNGVLTYQFFDLQMFVLLCGVPGSGKGTYSRLLERAVGKQNHTSAKMHRLGEDNVIANVIDKQLVICPDEKKQSGDNSGILSLTGGDNIPFRQIYKPMSNARFYGALVIVANANPFVGDTTGIDRRWSLVQFDKPLPARDTAIERKMQEEVGVLISLALAMPTQQATDLIKGIGDGAIPDFKRQQWIHKTENDSIALFMEEVLVPTVAHDFVLLGGKGDDPSTLYGAYVKMCDENNARNIYTKNNFRSHLLELCREVGWSSVKESRCGNGWRVYGVGIRESSDATPRISDWLGGVQTQCRECRPSVDPSVDLKPLPDKESVGSVDLSYPKNNSEDQQQPMLFAETPKRDDDPSEVYTPTLSSPNKDSSLHLGLHQVYTAYTQPLAEESAKSAKSLDADDTQPISQQIIANWDKQWQLGNLVLSVSLEELKAAIASYTSEQIKHLKDAANFCWQPQVNQSADYGGECVEIWEVTQGREIGIRSAGGNKTQKIKRGNLRPWLGI